MTVYTESEAAAQLRISAVTLAKLAKANRIEFIAGGTGSQRQHRRYTQAHIDAYLADGSKARERERQGELLSVAKASLTATPSTVGRLSRARLAARGLLRHAGV